MARNIAYCEECGRRLTLYVVGVCSQCDFDLTGRDDAREERDAWVRRETEDDPAERKGP